MARRAKKPEKPDRPKMDPIAIPAEKPVNVTTEIIEELKAAHPVTARIATESIPRKKRD